MNARLRIATWVAVALGAPACGLIDDSTKAAQLVCASDAECGPKQVCFADGCGDPGRDIVVEVTAAPSQGVHAQDFPVDNLRPQQDLQLFGPASLQGKVTRNVSATADGGVGPTAYRDSITVRATGTSRLIPGVSRHYEATLVPTDGAYAMPVGTGDYAVTVVPGDVTVPPITRAGAVDPGLRASLDFLLAAPEALVRLEGVLVEQGTQPVATDMEVQALDASLRPLSQRVRVERGTGRFVLNLAPEAARLATVLLAATSVNNDDGVPRKTFVVDPRVGLPEPLALGAYGTLVRVGGRVLDARGQPISGATVSMEGRVGGGGGYVSRPVLTGTDGRFELLSLPSGAEGALALVTVPPPASTARITRQAVTVPAELTVLPDITCQDRLLVTGTMLTPDGNPAPGVRIVAEPLAEVAGWPLPSSGTQPRGVTDADGHFEFRVDPATYRLDFTPGENLPRVSRFVTVQPVGSGDPGATRLEPFTLYKGRSITGLVTMPGGVLHTPGDLVPNASIRFFRVVTVAGKPSAVLLAQALSDSSGHYTVVLPTR
ncbi:carboxypeptidase-like regulatory domain-containing protein [Corallococcus sp. M34]|uniref:carboxypeptidase-like regulatory domain-containing protein n=1 Tax=Citreicoccus inhibens TaxID=2849499 RepID=UPI001C2449CC|nr:carboxypeptidase-like regulatory domain-containing protein [Citreicoccus inhibens]MBU8894555.1 carboxypeptidase-like regulatory domain-containing protein [Citreicoccus inhibens]